VFNTQKYCTFVDQVRQKNPQVVFTKDMMDAAFRSATTKLSKNAFVGKQTFKERMLTRVSTYILACEYDVVAKLYSALERNRRSIGKANDHRRLRQIPVLNCYGVRSSFWEAVVSRNSCRYSKDQYELFIMNLPTKSLSLRISRQTKHKEWSSRRTSKTSIRLENCRPNCNQR
jgi:hypothetical protein